jgi:DNA repair protein RecN (Recombination protein N)
MGYLFDLHGQHTHESLLRKEIHRVYLDRFSGLEDETRAFNKLFMELAEKRKTIETLNQSERDRETRIELLNFAVDEISKANPVKGEIKELEAETQRLGDFEKLTSHVNTAASALFDAGGNNAGGLKAEESILTLARRLRASLESAVSIDSSLSPVLKRLEDIYYEAEDLAGDFRNYRDRLSYDPERLAEAEERLSLLYRLKKKYGARLPDGGARQEKFSEGQKAHDELVSDEAGILAYKAGALLEIEALSGAEENRDKLKAEISALERELAARARDLSTKRREGAKRLSCGITGILAKLGMPNAAFSAQVGAKTSGQGLVLGPWGGDDVEFMISANKGEPLKELARIASGGELSRVMLSIKTILCGTGQDESPSPGNEALPETDVSAGTYIFDEVDTGIGGEVALEVGEYLSLIGRRKQIFCVTHLASIAVRADNHLKVEKSVITEGNGTQRTVTGVSLLGKGERRKEIARMLAGESGNVALAHADELLAKYSNKQSNVKLAKQR